jgi:hypothetical protein
MFGATPGVFKKCLAAYYAAKAYSIAENIHWLIVYKDVEFDGRYFRPCNIEDITVAEKEGWIKIDFESLSMLINMIISDKQDEYSNLLIDAIQDNKKFEVIRLLHSYNNFDLVMSKRVVDNNFDKWRKEIC